MSTTIDRRELLTQLNLLKVGLAKQEIYENSDCFCFQNGLAFTFNGDIACFVKLDIGITGAVMAVPFTSALGKLTGDAIEISQDDGNVLIACGDSLTGVKCSQQIYLPLQSVENPKKEDWKELPPNFADAVNLVESVVSRTDSDFQLSSVYVTPDFIEAADLNQVCRYNVKMPLEGSFLVRHGVLQQVEKMGVTHIACTENWLHFRNSSGFRVSCRKYNEAYLPAVEDVLTKERQGYQLVFPQVVLNAVNVAETFTDANVQHTGQLQVSLSREAKRITVKGDGLVGFHKQTIPCDGIEKDLEFFVSPALLKRVLGEFGACVVSESCLIVKSEHFLYLTSVNG